MLEKQDPIEKSLLDKVIFGSKGGIVKVDLNFMCTGLARNFFVFCLKEHWKYKVQKLSEPMDQGNQVGIYLHSVNKRVSGTERGCTAFAHPPKNQF